MQAVLEVRDIGKAYRNYGGEWRRVLSWFGLPLKPREEHWTLQHINFSIQPGEAVGIVGQNGAGKSTLLKIITGTLKPSSGQVTLRGRVAAILELGMGFHPDLSGRQNAYHTAGLMGYSQEQIDAVIGEIEAFAEVGEYFDQPVRTYSSGMQMRVAFAAATAWRPEILIVDEALSVGDAYFQHKSFDRIRQFQQQGTTLLLVSHDHGAILAVCNRAILLEKGHCIRDGEPEEVLNYYNATLAAHQDQQIVIGRADDGSVAVTSGTKEAEFLSVNLVNAEGTSATCFAVGEVATLHATIRVNKNIPNLTMGCGVKDRLGQMMFGTNTFYTKQIIDAPEQGAVYDIDVDFALNLGPSSYSVIISLHSNDSHISGNYDWREKEMIFEIVNVDKYTFVGSQWNPMTFRIGKHHA
jgi:lipopolysaccharide transport system ATP-binding protein